VYLVDTWGVLDVKAGGALLVRSPTGALLEARVPAPKDAVLRPIASDGWNLALNDGWTLAPGERAGDWKVVRSK
jgi:hypothetical protein